MAYAPRSRVDLGGGRGWLTAEAAASIFRIDRAIGHLLQITEAGRSFFQQEEHWLRYLRNGYPIALNPNTPSVHQIGDAIDSDEAQRFIELMADHGWVRTVYRWVNGKWTLVERWHFEYFIGKDNHRNDPAPSGVEVIIPKSEEDDDMSLIRWDRTGAIFVLGSEKIKYVATPEEAAALRRRHGQEINLSDEELTFQLNAENISWDVVEAVLSGRAQSGDGRFWSRLTAEGIAIRGEQTKSQKTIDDVLKTAIRIEQGG